jgi:hypothetical protein
MSDTGESLDRQLQRFAEALSLSEQTRAVAEAVKTEAMASLLGSSGNDPAKQKLAADLRVEPGGRPGQWLVVSPGDYGRRVEFGNKDSPESPFFAPALVTVRGLIRNCLRRAPSNGLQRTRRPRGGR